MSDDRLFASNNAIGRKGYIINLITLAAITYATNRVFDKYIFPFVTDEVYHLIAKVIFFFLIIIYAITLLSLVDRRAYDICGTRDSGIYKNISGFFTLFVLILAIVVINHFKNIITFIPNDMLETAGTFSIFAILFIIFILSFFKGQFSNLTFDQYKKKTKYE